MQIVIDISEEQYKRICNHTDGIYDMTSLLTIVENGIPLPKGHGRLIDADKLFVDIEWHDIEDAPTVIEAED